MLLGSHDFSFCGQMMMREVRDKEILFCLPMQRLSTRIPDSDVKSTSACGRFSWIGFPRFCKSELKGAFEKEDIPLVKNKLL